MSSFDIVFVGIHPIYFTLTLSLASNKLPSDRGDRSFHIIQNPSLFHCDFVRKHCLIASIVKLQSNGMFQKLVHRLDQSKF